MARRRESVPAVQVDVAELEAKRDRLAVRAERLAGRSSPTVPEWFVLGVQHRLAEVERQLRELTS